MARERRGGSVGGSSGTGRSTTAATPGKRTLVEQRGGSVRSPAAPSAAQPGKTSLTQRLDGQGDRAEGPAGAPLPERHEPLDAATAQRYGQQLGADFSGVTVHHGDGVAEEHGASAITFGSDIHFSSAASAGPWQEGLLGHELVHTVQQGAVPIAGDARTGSGSGSSGSAEAEAETVGRAAARGEAGEVTVRVLSGAQAKVAAEDPAAAGPSDTEADDAEAQLEAAVSVAPLAAAPGAPEAPGAPATSVAPPGSVASVPEPAAAAPPALAAAPTPTAPTPGGGSSAMPDAPAAPSARSRGSRPRAEGAPPRRRATAVAAARSATHRPR
jgi:Domain of unknown function (DUF4157)